MKHLVDDFGVTAWIATLVLIGAFTILIVVPEQVVKTMAGQWIGAIVAAFFVLKSAKNKPKEP